MTAVAGRISRKESTGSTDVTTEPKSATYGVETIAKLLLLTPRSVQRLTQDGVIPRSERGRYEIAPAVQGYIKYLRDRALNDDVDGGDTSSTNSHKRRLLKARADQAEREELIQRGEFVAIEDVGAAVEAEYSGVRSNLMQMPAEIAPDLEGLEAVAIAELLTLKVEEILTALAADRRQDPH